MGRPENGAALRFVASAALVCGSCSAPTFPGFVSADPVVVIEDAGSDVSSLAFSPDSTAVLVGTNPCARLWDVASGTERVLLRRPERDARSGSAGFGSRPAVFSPDGRMVVAASNACVYVFDASSGELRWRLETPFDSRQSVAVTADSSTLVWAGSQSHGMWRSHWRTDVIAWDLSTGNVARRETIEDAQALGLSADGSSIAIIENTKSLCVLELASRERSLEWDGLKQHGFRGVSFAPDGRSVGAVHFTRGVDVFSLTVPRAPRATLQDRDLTSFSSFAISPDGTLGAIGAVGSTVELVHLPAGTTACKTMYRKFPYGPGGVEAVAFSSDGKLLAEADGPERLLVWNVDELLADPSAVRPTSAARNR